MKIIERSIPMNIILSIVTCGFYGLYWFITLTDDSNIASNEPSPMSGGMALGLTLITCGLFGIYWAFNLGQKMDRINNTSGSYNIIFLLLSLFGFGFVAFIIAQSDLNKYARQDKYHY